MHILPPIFAMLLASLYLWACVQYSSMMAMILTGLAAVFGITLVLEVGFAYRRYRRTWLEN